MINFVTGLVHSVSQGSVVLDTGGLGLELVATARCLAEVRPGQQVTLPASLVVREESWTLYGFADFDERACFQALQQAKGVGPRVAINLLGALTPDQLRIAVARGDAAALTVAPGVGAKGAARLVIDLRDRLGPVTGQAAATPAAAVEPVGGWQREVHAALVGLGWPTVEASAAVDRVAEQVTQDNSLSSGGPARTGALLRLALQSLDRRTDAR